MRTSHVLVAASCVLFWGAVVGEKAVSAGATPTAPSNGQLYGLGDRVPVQLPLIKTETSAHITGSVASVTVKQTFRNPNAKPLEAIYVFPLPQNAAVHRMAIHVRGKTISGTIKRRSDAQELYNQAKKAGKTTARLDQERPNIFTQAIANIFPKSNVEVELQFDVQLRFEDGFYAFEFPMLVGQRYIPGDANGKPAVGWGESADTDRVPDASKITPPVAPPEKRSGRSIQLKVTLDPGAAIRELDSPTHTITSRAVPELGKHARSVELANANEIPNRDFVVRYRLADKRPAMGVLSHMDSRGGFFALRFEPPSKPEANDISAKEMVFVVDTSDSMEGSSIELARAAMRFALANLNPNDTFQIIRSSSSTSKLSSSALPNTPSNRERAMKYVAGLEAGGESEMLAALESALAKNGTRSRLRIVSLLTTGHVGNENEILSAVSKKMGDNTRLFAFGVGSTPNRYLLERMVEVGRGSAQYMLPNEPADAQVATFYKRLHSPVLTHIEIDWKGLVVEELRPARIPDLFVGQPLSLVGRFARPGSAKIEVRGKMGSRRVVYEVPVSLERKSDDSAAIARVWARAKVRDLEVRSLRGASLAEEITQVGLSFGLVTRHTSFVAVAQDKKIAPGSLRTLMVPVDSPADATRAGAIDVAEAEAPADDAHERTTVPTVEQGDGDRATRDEDQQTQKKEAEKREADKRDKEQRTKEKKKLDQTLSKDAPAPKPTEPTADTTARSRYDEYDGNDDDDDDSDGDGGGGGDGDDDYEDAPASRVASKAVSGDVGEEFTLEGRVRRGILGAKWRLGVGLALGATSGALDTESSFAASTTLTLERAISQRLALGTSVALLIRGPENDRVIGNLLLSASYLDLLGRSVNGVRLELSVGVGPSVSTDGAGLGLMGALKLRIPIPVALQLRYDGALRFTDDDESTGSVTGGFEFSF